MAPKDEVYSKKNPEVYLTKKCPECYVHLPMDAKVCTSCKARVGEVDKLGFAIKPTDWWGYLIAVLSIVGFVVFMWWAFFRE